MIHKGIFLMTTPNLRSDFMMSHDDMMGCVVTESCCGEVRAATAKDAAKLRWWNFKLKLRNLWHWRTAWAVRYLSEQLQKDKGFRDSWHANIAMPIYDATRPQRTCDQMTFTGHFGSCPQVRANEVKNYYPMTPELCNDIADRLMKHLFNA